MSLCASWLDDCAIVICIRHSQQSQHGIDDNIMRCVAYCPDSDQAYDDGLYPGQLCLNRLTMVKMMSPSISTPPLSNFECPRILIIASAPSPVNVRSQRQQHHLSDSDDNVTNSVFLFIRIYKLLACLRFRNENTICLAVAM